MSKHTLPFITFRLPTSAGGLSHNDRAAVLRARAVVSDAHAAAGEVARTINTRQAAGETSDRFVRRIALAVLDEIGGAA